jgi:hypothetical protein
MGRVGDVLGDWFVRGLAVWIVLGVLYALLSAIGLTWERAPGVVVASVVVLIAMGLLVRRALAPEPQAGHVRSD